MGPPSLLQRFKCQAIGFVLNRGAGQAVREVNFVHVILQLLALACAVVLRSSQLACLLRGEARLRHLLGA